MISPKIRVRFAPSPTGYLHVGGLRTALFNYLLARNQGGEFILRIEDTDRTRYVEDAVDKLIKIMEWVGLEYDEGPEKGGNFGPYLQSERLDIYNEHIQELIEHGHAYYCFCTKDRLDEVRKQQQMKGQQGKYDKHCLHLSKAEIEEKLKSNISKVVRLNVPENQKIVLDDIIRGNVEFDSSIVDDQVLIKSDGFPTYHFANVVDDHLMKITHVIRGEEWLPSSPKHILLYDYFGWEKPVFAHLPLLLNPDRSKLSKRQGDVAVEDYRDKGYLEEALLNFVLLLGWNPGDEREFFYLSEMVNAFSIDKINKAGAVFNIEKLNWLNAEHLRKKSNEELLPLLKKELVKAKFDSPDFSDDYLLQVIEAMKERVSFVKEYIEKSPYFFKGPEEYDKNVINKRWKSDSPQQLKEFKEAVEKLDNPTKEDFENTLRKTAEELNIGAGKLIHIVRLAVSGIGTGPGVFDILFILGKDAVIKRIEIALQKIKI